MRLPREVAGFDSASAMTVALARFLRGRDTPPLGRPAGRALLPIARAANRLPARAKETIYSAASGAEAQPARRLAALDMDDVAAGITRLYPRRRYPAVMLGSSSGALVHLCAALGIPWLPQTLLLPLRQRRVPVDDPTRAAHAFDATARALLTRNPDLVLHHMHDPNQDRLTLRRVAYFRVKRTRLGSAYRRFLTQTLAPGGVLFLAECRRTWPTTRIDDRHVFQFGAVGGITPREYHDGSLRVADYLRRYRTGRTRWDAPIPDGDSPEAELGFDDGLRDDVLAFARRHGYRVRRLTFHDPQDLSPLVADLYRWWYRQRQVPADRLLVESFILLDPWWTLRTGSVPYWTTFPVQPSADALAGYLDRSDPYDRIHLALFCHGVESAGLATARRWHELLSHARIAGSFAGVMPQRFPRDLATFFAFQPALRAITARHPIPPPLPITGLDAFLETRGHRYPEVGIEATA
jgi:hypothetical protein